MSREGRNALVGLAFLVAVGSLTVAAFLGWL